MSRSAFVLKHSSRAAQLVRSDRYSLIRTFFTRPPPPPPSLLARRLSIRPVPVSLHTLPLRRNFRLSSGARGDHPSTRTNPELQERRQKPTSDARPVHDHPSANLYDNNYPRFFRRLAQSLPHVSRPSLDDFLSAANGISQRMRVRVRWFFIRNFRKFNADDISAFVTWFLVGQGLWILVGTSVGIATRCSLQYLLYST